MAFSISTQSRALFSGFQLSSGVQYPLGFSDYLGVISSTKELSVRRVCPIDKFAGATSRSHEGYTISQTTASKVSGSLTTVAPVSYWTRGGWPSVELTGAAVAAQSRIRAKIKQQNMNLAQSLAEYRQTSRMFSELSQTIFRSFRSLRNGRAFGDFVRSLQQPRSRTERQIANRWLQFQYGIRPLMSDLYASCDVMSTKIRTGVPIYVKTKKQIVNEFNDFTSFNGSFPRHNREVEAVSLVCRYTISEPALKQLAQIGISNPLLLIWELIPYSFVVDWMFPIGNFLSSLDSLNGTSNLRGVQTRRYNITSYAAAYGGVNTFLGRKYNRVSIGALSLPSLAYKPSDSKIAVLNGLALLTQLRRR